MYKDYKQVSQASWAFMLHVVTLNSYTIERQIRIMRSR